jgi:hypothetical protein
MTQPSQEEPFDEVYDGPDPDVQSIEEAGDIETGEERTLVTEQLMPEDDLNEYEAPQNPSTPTAEGFSPLDEEYGETIDERLAQEEPDVSDT